jgi:hypothetical protein
MFILSKYSYNTLARVIYLIKNNKNLNNLKIKEKLSNFGQWKWPATLILAKGVAQPSHGQFGGGQTTLMALGGGFNHPHKAKKKKKKEKKKFRVLPLGVAKLPSRAMGVAGNPPPLAKIGVAGHPH